MKALPIALSTEMVYSTLEDIKTQTRRICKHQFWSYSELVDVNTNGITQKVDRSVSCPYGQVGDVLWVREEHKITFSTDKSWVFVEFRNGSRYQYRMKHLDPQLALRLLNRKTIGKWQRARFLPKDFARIHLEITKIRVQRLQDISEQDAEAEGIRIEPDGYFCWNYMTSNWGDFGFNPISSFLSLWEYINGVKSLDTNPWVWVIEFKRVDNPFKS